MAWDLIQTLKAIALPHASTHGSAGNDAVTPAAIGASATGHSHLVAAHASTHGSAGSDPVTPAAIGAATSGHTHSASAAKDPGLMHLNVGEETIPRQLLKDNCGLTTQSLRLTYFIADKGEVTTKVRMRSGTIAMTATPTTILIGLYLVNADGSLTRVATTANNTGLFAAANTAYEQPWVANYTKVAGQLYALAVLVVSSFAVGNVIGTILATAAAEEAVMAPRMNAALQTQTTLPTTIAANAAFVITTALHYGVILP